MGSGGVAGDALFDNILIQTIIADPADLTLGIHDGNYAGIEISGTTGALDQVEYSTELLSATNWTAISNIVLHSSPHLFIDTQPIHNHPARFYRATIVE